MAVYTHLSEKEISELLAHYAGLGKLVSAQGIAEGVENSNYLLVLNTPNGEETRYILTIFEQRVKVEELPFYMGLMEHLVGKGIPCPQPVAAADGSVIQILPETQKRAVLVSFLQGAGISAQYANAAQLREVGALMAQMHQAARDYGDRRANALSIAGWRKLFEQTAERADEVTAGLRDMIEQELLYLMQAWPVAVLPSGVVHADLFPDNIFFREGALSGVIDFYFACNDAFAYDFVITMNAWCFDAEGGFKVEKAREMLAGYEAQRPLTDAERQHFNTLARGASLRFLLTRLYDWLNVVEGAVVTPKDPMEYVRKLRFHQSVSDFDGYGW